MKHPSTGLPLLIHVEDELSQGVGMGIADSAWIALLNDTQGSQLLGEDRE
jgi:hypothetical protein